MNIYRKQAGVVLIFSILILFLVTLLGVNMVQQNRIQFLMVSNSQEQSNSFASVEGVLRLVEDYIDQTRDGNDDSICDKTVVLPFKLDQIKPAIITNLIGLSATFTAANTVVAEITKTSCVRDVAGTVSETECIVTAGNWDIGEGNCNQITSNNCPTELYTISIVITNATGAKKEIESRYAVRCDGI